MRSAAISWARKFRTFTISCTILRTTIPITNFKPFGYLTKANRVRGGYDLIAMRIVIEASFEIVTATISGLASAEKPT